MTTRNRNGGASARARATADVTDEWLCDEGRWPVCKLPNGSLRTYMWANLDDRCVTPRFEQMRIYSKPNDYGTSRGLEASDMVHVLKSLEETKLFAKDMGWQGSPVVAIDARTVHDTAISVRSKRPEKTIVSGNVAVLVWVNKASDDFVCKTEFFTVLDPYTVVRGFGLESIDAVRRCYVKAAEFILDLYAELQQSNVRPSRPRR